MKSQYFWGRTGLFQGFDPESLPICGFRGLRRLDAYAVSGWRSGASVPVGSAGGWWRGCDDELNLPEPAMLMAEARDELRRIGAGAFRRDVSRAVSASCETGFAKTLLAKGSGVHPH